MNRDEGGQIQNASSGNPAHSKSEAKRLAVQSGPARVDPATWWPQCNCVGVEAARVKAATMACGACGSPLLRIPHIIEDRIRANERKRHGIVTERVHRLARRGEAVTINTWCCGLPVKGTACFRCERTVEEIVDGTPSEARRRIAEKRALDGATAVVLWEEIRLRNVHSRCSPREKD